MACEEADFRVALPLLRRGVDPAETPLDSLWEVGVQCLVQGLLEEEDAPSIAAAWAYWGKTLRPSIEPDPIILWPEAVEAFDTVRVAEDADAITSVWTWPVSGMPQGGDGYLEVVGPSGLHVTVGGVQTVALGGILRLSVGVHTVRAEAPGYETLETTQVVLPGVTLTLGFDLVPSPVVAEEPRHGTIELRLPAGAPADALIVVRPRDADLQIDMPMEGPPPFTFVGPPGTYTAQVRRAGVVVDEREFTLAGDESDRVFLLAPELAQEPIPAPPVATRRKGKRFPWIVAVIGAAGAGAAAFLLLGGSEEQISGEETGNVPIVFTVP
jgi:hypothetical protein